MRNNSKDFNYEIKKGLQNCHEVLNKGKYPKQEYQLLNQLAELYISEGEIREYPKVVAIYQYMMKLQQDRGPGLEVKIAAVEEEFIKKAKGLGSNKLEKVKEYKKRLEEFRGIENSEQYGESVRARLKGIEDLGIVEGQEELDEGELQKRAKEVEKIYMGIREFFIGEGGLIKDLISDCIEDLGGLPLVNKNGEKREVEYAIFGMGSMALGTMTPWSDMEFGILIEDGLGDEEKIVKEYFRNLTSLLHIRVINFGETPLRMMGIEELNNFKSGKSEDDWFYDELINPGFSFDGPHWHACKTPLGRKGFKNYKDFELIGTPEEVLKFQLESQWQEKDMPLVQALWQTTPIKCSEPLLRRYQGALDRKFISSNSFRLLKEDNAKIDSFNQLLGTEREGQLLNVKKEIYRFPDRIIVALSDCIIEENVFETTTWKKVKILEGQGKINNIGSGNLQIALSIATEVRLRTYASNNSRTDNLSAIAKIEFHINELKEGELIEQVFYLDNPNMLYRYYYTALSLSLLINNIDALEVVQAILGKVMFNINDPLFMDKQSRQIELMYKGFIYQRFLQYDKAIEEFEKILEDKHSEIVWNLGRLYSLVGKHEDSYRSYSQSLNTRRNATKPDTLSVAEALNNKAGSLRALKKLNEALECYQESLKMKQSLYGEDSPSTCSTLSNIGLCLKELGRRDESLDSYNNALRILEAYGKNNALNHQDNMVMANVFSNIGAHELENDHCEEALKLYFKAFSILKKNCSMLSNEVTEVLYNIGLVYEKLKQKIVAVEYYQECLNVDEKLYKSPRKFTYSLLNNIIAILLELGRNREVLFYVEKAIKMDKRTLNFDSQDIMALYTNMAKVLEEADRDEEALKYAELAIVMHGKLTKPDPSYIIGALNNKGACLDKLGRYEEALKVKLETLANNLGDNEMTAIVLSNIGVTLRNLNRYEEAVEYGERAIRESQNIGPSGHNSIEKFERNLFKSRFLLANQYMMMGNNSQAIMHYMRILIEGKSLEQIPSGETIILSHLLYYMTKAFYRKGDVNLAMSGYEVLSAKLMTQVREIKLDLACIYHVQALREHIKGNQDRYLEYLSKANSIFELVFGLNMSGHPDASTYTEYAQFLFKHHEKKNVVEYKKIVWLLENAVRLGNDESGLAYGKLEKEMIIKLLQKMIDEKGRIEVRPGSLAYYLLTKVHLIHSNYHRARGALAEFSKIEEKTEVCEKLYKSAKQEVAATVIQKSWREYIKKKQNEVSVEGQTIH